MKLQASSDDSQASVVAAKAMQCTEAVRLPKGHMLALELEGWLAGVRVRHWAIPFQQRVFQCDGRSSLGEKPHAGAQEVPVNIRLGDSSPGPDTPPATDFGQLPVVTR